MYVEKYREIRFFSIGAPDIQIKAVLAASRFTVKFFIQDIVKIAVDNGQGWADYLWPRPGTTKPVRKSSFVKKIVVRGEILVVGTGVYLD